MKLLKGISTVAFLLVLYPLSTFADTWAMRLGGQGQNYNWAKSVEETPDGGFVVAGSTTFQTLDYWIIKLDDKGSMVWQKAYDGPSHGEDELKSFQETSDNGFIAAGSTGGPGDEALWILKLDNSGNIIWQKTYSHNGTNNPYSVQETSDGGFIVSGTDFTPGSEDSDATTWLLKLDESGEVVWQKTYSEQGSIARSVQETTDQGFIVAGSFEGDCWILKVDSSGDVIWQNAYGIDSEVAWANAVRETADGEFLVAGVNSHQNEDGSEGSDALLFKLDGMGNIIWQKSYGGHTYDGSKNLRVTADGMIIVAGTTGAWREHIGYNWIFKLDGNGNIIWQKEGFLDSSYEGVEGIAETSDGGFMVAGMMVDVGGPQQGDLLVLKLDGNGNIPGCNIMRDANGGAKEISLSQTSLGTEHGDLAETSEQTSIEPVDTDIMPTSQCSGGGADHLISSDFDIDADGFTYHDDTFKNTNQPLYADGEWVPADWHFTDSGALSVSVGGVDGVDIIDGMSGGWSKSFTLSADANTEISLAYSLNAFYFDADECAEALVAIDGEVVKVLNKVCGRDSHTGWVTASFDQFLSEGTHTLTVGAYNNKKTGPREQAIAFFDDISIVINDPSLAETECADGMDNDEDGLADCDDSDCSNASECSSDAYLVEDFEAGHDLFQYQDDLFNDTHRAPYANGQWVEEGNSSVGGLQLTLGNVDNRHISNGISGGWQGQFGMSEPSEVTVSVDYRLVMTRFDADECAQVLVQVDDGPVEAAAELCGRGQDTDWQTHTFVQSLPSGEHSLSIGGFVNKKTGQREKADIYFDNVEVR